MDNRNEPQKHSIETTLANAPVLVSGESTQVWVHSDLQLSNPDVAREVLTRAVDDLLSLDLKLGAAWCLGDAVTGKNPEPLDEVAAINVEQLARLNVPICFVMGNHEMDLKRADLGDRYPLYERVRHESNWHTMDSLDEFFFVREVCGNLVVFMGDHAALDGHWWTTHGMIKDEVELYPYPPEIYAALRDALAEVDKPVIIASHYSYPGGQRPSALMGQMLPLPQNVGVHLYGHAHIGDLVHNAERPWQRDNPIEGQALRQFNISALETKRSPGSHSAILEIGPGGPTKIRIRCHLEKRWTETFDLAPVKVLV